MLVHFNGYLNIFLKIYFTKLRTDDVHDCVISKISQTNILNTAYVHFLFLFLDHVFLAFVELLELAILLFLFSSGVFFKLFSIGFHFCLQTLFLILFEFYKKSVITKSKYFP